jgi:hexokinase
MHFICIDNDIELMGKQSMNVTWVLGWPDGHEQGQFLTTDLGGTNLRVCWVTLKERKGETEMTQEEFKLSDEVKVGDGEDLFNFIAECLGDFIKKHEIEGTKENPIQLGFTFSYPAHQDYIDHGKLVTWTKGFEVKGVEGNDAAGMLRDAMAKKVCTSMLPNGLCSFAEGPTNTPRCTHKRHYRRHDSVSIRRPRNHSRRHLWHRLQRSVHGGRGLNTQTGD